MGRFRNPRFAPEWLESRLSPSAFVGVDYAQSPAEVQTTTSGSGSTTNEPLPTDENGDPIPEPVGEIGPAPIVPC